MDGQVVASALTMSAMIDELLELVNVYEPDLTESGLEVGDLVKTDELLWSVTGLGEDPGETVVRLLGAVDTTRTLVELLDQFGSVQVYVILD